MQEIYKPPQTIPNDIKDGVFLAGSIEMGKAEDWQTWVGKSVAEFGHPVFNPRRDDWDSSWEQTIEHDEFRNQVLWELNALDQAMQIIMYFSPGTQSPISLLELGLYASSGKLLVCCPEGFWRKGNVDVTGLKYGFEVYPNLEALLGNHF